MKYTELTDYPFHWVFKRPDLEINDQDLEKIKPLAPQHADQIWRKEVSASAKELDRLNSGDWPRNSDNWHSEYHWDSDFNSDNVELPTELAKHLGWNNDTVVYICYEPGHVLETRFSAFKRCWKGFLFAADQALIVGRKQATALWFIDELTVKLGRR